MRPSTDNVLLGRVEEGRVILTNPELGGVRAAKAMVDLDPPGEQACEEGGITLRGP